MTPRLIAATNKRKTYHGSICRRCKSTVKWTSSGACKECDSKRSAAYYKRIRDLMKSTQERE